MALTDDLAGNWHINSGWTDATGNNDLTPSGATINTVDQLLGAGCGDFDGIDDYSFKDTAVTALGGTDKMTLMAWVKRDKLGAFQNIFAYGSVANFKYVLLRFTSGNEVRADFGNDADNAFSILRTTDTFSDTTDWHQIIATYDAGTVKIYFDNVNRTGFNFGSWTGDVTTTDILLRMGNAGPGNLSPYGGLVDETAIWNRVITSAERTELFNGGVGVEIGVGISGRRRRMETMRLMQ